MSEIPGEELPMPTPVENQNISSETQSTSIADWLRDLYTKKACNDPWSIKRYSACRVLKESRIPCYVWSEDALSYYGVPTAVFDVCIIVDDVKKAAEVLIEGGWYPPPPEFKARYTDIKEATYYLVPPQRSYGRSDCPTADPLHSITAIMAALDWNIRLPDIALDTYHLPQRDDRWSFIPPLHVLLDSLIGRWLDAPDEPWGFQMHLAVFLGYLYSHVSILSLSEFSHHLRIEHRQYHFDVIAGVSYGTEIFRKHQRKVRDSIQKGEYELRNCSIDYDDERFFTKGVEARLLASLPPVD